MTKPLYDVLWRDRDILFDCSLAILKPRSGEKLIDSLDSVEDTKGNNGDKGRLIVTNLRIIWHSHAYPKINLSIGFNCIVNVTTKSVISKLKGHTEALFVLTKNHTTRYEFIFTNLVAMSTRLFTSVIAVHRAYDTTRLYRDMKLRISLLEDGKVSLLPQEQAYSETRGVWNLSSDQGNLGIFLLTNIRLIWYSALNSNFNVSLPYIQIKSAKISDSKFGKALVIQTSEQSGGYLLGFRTDPFEKLTSVLKEVTSFMKVYQTSPNFGVDFQVDNKNNAESITVNKTLSNSFLDDVEIDESSEQCDVFANYLAGKSEKSEPEYNEDLGLVIGKLQEGYTLSGLWNVIQKK